MISETIVVRPIPAAETRLIRQQVLRPTLPIEDSIYPNDEAPQTLHVGAYQDGEHVGVATIFPEAAPGGPDTGAWRLRGMATLPYVRGNGLGGAMLHACIRHVAQQGGTVLWCNARENAVGFYQRFGFTVTSERFELPLIGPHYVMRREIGPADRLA